MNKADPILSLPKEKIRAERHGCNPSQRRRIVCGSSEPASEKGNVPVHHSENDVPGVQNRHLKKAAEQV